MTDQPIDRREKAAARRNEVIEGWYLCRCQSRRQAVKADSPEQAASLMASFCRTKSSRVFVALLKRIAMPRKGESALTQDASAPSDWTKYRFVTQD